MAEEKLFKELELGFRELFRILIPGAYALVLTQVIDPTSSFSQAIAKNTASGLAATFFLGLIGYALRTHERWFPYFVYFEQQRASLNAEIARITGLSEASDNVATYKYFLETDAEDVNDRIHYFSSFYYMLVELSLLSASGAYFLTAKFLFKATIEVSPRLAFLSMEFIMVACAIQIVVLFPLGSVRTTRTRMFIGLAVVLGLLALFVMIIGGWGSVLSFRFAFGKIGWTPLILMLLGYLFWRLGEKHWRQIVSEQIVLVNARAPKLIEAARKFYGPAAPLVQG